MGNVVNTASRLESFKTQDGSRQIYEDEECRILISEALTFTGIPSFAPELFRRAVLKDPLRMKQLQKGLGQLCEEGATQLFRPLINNDLILGAVGQLQFDVVAFQVVTVGGGADQLAQALIGRGVGSLASLAVKMAHCRRTCCRNLLSQVLDSSPRSRQYNTNSGTLSSKVNGTLWFSFTRFSTRERLSLMMVRSICWLIG